MNTYKMKKQNQIITFCLIYVVPKSFYLSLFHDESPCHIETSPLICSANQWTGFYMIENSAMKELTHFIPLVSFYTP